MDRLNDEKKAADINLKAVQKENRKRRKVIEAYQDMMNAGATGLHPVCFIFQLCCFLLLLYFSDCVPVTIPAVVIFATAIVSSM